MKLDFLLQHKDRYYHNTHQAQKRRYKVASCHFNRICPGDTCSWYHCPWDNASTAYGDAKKLFAEKEVSGF